MTTKPVWFLVEVSIKPNGLAHFEALVNQMSDLTLNEPGALVYKFFLSPDRTRCRVVEHYADGAAVLAHMTGPVIQTLVPKALEHASIDRFSVFGDPGKDALPILKALGADIYDAWNGFARG